MKPDQMAMWLGILSVALLAAANPSVGPVRAGPSVSSPITIERLAHTVTPTSVLLSGILRNLGQVPRYNLVLVAAAETFRSEPSGEIRQRVAVDGLRPGAQELFTLDLGKDLWQHYRIRVESYTGERLLSVAGSISQNDYFLWSRDDLASFVKLNVSTGARIITVTIEPALPAYARFVSATISVDYNVSQGGISTRRTASVLLTNTRLSSEIQVPCTSTAFCVVSAQGTIDRLNWQLNF